MLCPKCEKEFPDKYEFCPFCGETVAAEEKTADAAVSAEDVPINTEEQEIKKKKKWLLPAIIALVVVILGGVFAWLYFGGVFKGDVGLGCKACSAKIEQGYYCKNCIKQLHSADNSGACIRCSLERICKDGIDISIIGLKNGNRVCEKLSMEEIFLVDKNGYYYCPDCESKKLCSECEGFLDPEDDDDICAMCVHDLKNNGYRNCKLCLEVVAASEVYCAACQESGNCEKCLRKLHPSDDDLLCFYCAKYSCYDCHEVLTMNEVSHRFANYNIYCSTCDTGNYCLKCRGVIEKDDDDALCWRCAEFSCRSCCEVLTEKEVKYVWNSGYGRFNYCSTCDTGHYCSKCKCMIAGNDDDDVCSTCAKYACWICNEVLKKDEVSFSRSDEDSEYYYCEKCDTKHYCEECGYVLLDEQQTKCLSHREYYDCAFCFKTCEKKEIVYSYTDKFSERLINCCKTCYTGNYCDACGKLLTENDDDSICYQCAEFTCFDCSEVIGVKDVVHSYDDGPNSVVRLYCAACYTGNYCDKCGYMLAKDDDDSTCWLCAEYWCLNCNEVLTEQDISYVFAKKHYYCSECDTGHYCDNCGLVLWNKKDTLCENCADTSEYVDVPCDTCDTRMDKEDVAYSYTDAYGTSYYYCSECDNGNYCEECGYMLVNEDENLCYVCMNA